MITFYMALYFTVQVAFLFGYNRAYSDVVRGWYILGAIVYFILTVGVLLGYAMGVHNAV